MSNIRTVRTWLRRVLPDLLLATVVALLLTMAANHLEEGETARIRDDLRVASVDGVSLDEHLEALSASVRRSTLLHLPLLAAGGGALVGLGCRSRRWAPLTAIAAAAPTFLWAVALLIDRPALASGGVVIYAAAAVVPAVAAASARARVRRAQH